MHDRFDEREIEAYLKEFRPAAPAPLPKRGRGWRSVAWSVAAAAAAAVIAVMIVLPQPRPMRPAVAESTPMTIGSADKLLAGASSWKSAIDDAGFAFRASPAHAGGGRSALDFLAQEDLSK